MAKTRRKKSIYVSNGAETMAAATKAIPQGLSSAVINSTIIMKGEWVKSYDETGPIRWSKESPYAGSYWKGRANMPVTLKDGGGLSPAVHATQFVPEMSYGGKGYVMKFNVVTAWPRARNGDEYVWYHEFGTDRMPRREFMETALNEANKRMSDEFKGQLARVGLILKEPHKFGVKATQKRGFLSMLSPMAFATILIPPVAPFSQALMAIGAASDIQAIAKGSLFEEGSIRNFLSAWAGGMMGITPRSQRRRARRKLWSGVV